MEVVRSSKKVNKTMLGTAKCTPAREGDRWQACLPKLFTTFFIAVAMNGAQVICVTAFATKRELRKCKMQKMQKRNAREKEEFL